MEETQLETSKMSKRKTERKSKSMGNSPQQTAGDLTERWRKGDGIMKLDYKIITLFAILGLLFWLFSCIFDSLFYYDGTFWELLITDVPAQALYVRSVVYALLLVFGLLVSRILWKRKQVEDALRQSEEYFRSLVEDALDAIVVLNIDGTIRYRSSAYKGVTGYEPEERIGESWFDHVHPDDMQDATDKFARLLHEPRATMNTEIRSQHKDGSWRHIDVVGRNLFDDPVVAGIILTFRDITERHRMEQQLQLTGRLAAVGELAAGVAHELNNPLTSVQAYAQFLTARKDLDESIKSDVGIIYKEAQRACKITSNLLSFAHKHEPQKSFIYINEALAQSMDLHTYRMSVNDIEVSVELDPDLPKSMADFHQLQQVFVNLITNAEQAMTEAHGKGKLSIKTQKVDDMIQITFADNGPGMPEDDLKRIFDPFFTTKDVGQGTGLGLSICYGIVQEHGGNLYAKSKPGKGTTFVVEIPIVSEGQAASQPTDTVQIEQAPTQFKLNK